MSAAQDFVEDTVDTATDFVGDTADAVGDAVEGVGDAVVDVVDFVVEDVLEPVGEAVVNTINYALENPVDAAIMIAAASTGQWWALPAASAAITLSHGGTPEEAAKAAAITYATQEFMTQTQMGQDISASTSATGAEAGAAATTSAGASASTAAVISKGVTASLNGAIIGGMRSVLTGQDIGTGIAQGATAGAAYGATDQYFQNLLKEGSLNFTDDPKLNAKIAKSMGAASGAALGAVLTDKDPATAVGNYIAYKMMDIAKTEVAATAKSTYKSMKDSLATLDASKDDLLARQDSYNKQFADLDKRSDDYNSHVVEYQNKLNSEWTPVQAKLDEQKNAYESALAKYKEQEAIYNNASLPVEARNAAAKEMGAYAQQTADASKAYDAVFDANKGLYDDLQATGNSLKSTKTTLDSDFAALQNSEGAQLNAAKSTFDKELQKYESAKAAADEANQNYEKQIVEVVTREMAIDAINEGLVAPTKTNEDGSVTFENGITLNTDGSMYQGGNQLFTSAEDVPQKELRFANEQGKSYWFDESANRLASDTDVQDVYKNNYGLDVTKDEALKFAGKSYDQADNDEVKDFAIDKIGSEFEKYGYKAPDESTLASYIDKGGNSIAKVDTVIDPYYVDELEAKDFVKSTLGREATPEEVAMLVGTKAESSALGAQSAQEAQMYDTLKNLFGAAQQGDYGFDVGAATEYAALSPQNQKIASDASLGFLNGALDWDAASSKVNTAVESDIKSGYLKSNGDGTYTAPDGTVYFKNETTGTWDNRGGVEGGEGTGSEELQRAQFMKDFFASTVGKNQSPGTAKELVAFPTSTSTGTSADGSGTTGTGTGAGSGTGVGTGTGTGAGNGTGTGGTGGLGGVGGTTGAGSTSGGTTPTGGSTTGATTTPTTDPATKPTTGTTTTGGVTTSGGGGGGGGFGDLSSYMTGALALGSGFGAGTAPTPLKPSELTSKDPGTKFEGALQQFQEFASKPFYDENTYADQFVNQPQTPQQEPEFMNTPYYNYGELDNIEDILNPQTDEQPTQYAAQGGLMATPLMATGGMTGTRHGQYAHGGLSTPIVHHSGKARVDFRHGDAVTGAGDGQSDDIPAMLADGEFVFPADVVAAIGNGSTKAGSDKLYDMMHGIRSHVRSAKPKDLPPEIKSPLDFLKTKPKKARR